MEPIFGWESYTKVLYVWPDAEENERFSALRQVISSNMQEGTKVTYQKDLIDQIDWEFRFIYSYIPNGQKGTQ